jgi:hypothetical protein
LYFVAYISNLYLTFVVLRPPSSDLYFGIQ